MDSRLEGVINKVMAEHNKPTIFGTPMPCYDYEDSRHPDHLRVMFSDGTTAIYHIHREQPAPQIRESIEIIRSWNNGYQYEEPAKQPKRRRAKR